MKGHGTPVDVGIIIHCSPTCAFYRSRAPIAYALIVLTYSVLYGFWSTSGPRFSGVHFGSSLNNLMATIYYNLSALSTAHLGIECTNVVIRGGKSVIDPCWKDNQIILLLVSVVLNPFLYLRPVWSSVSSCPPRSFPRNSPSLPTLIRV